MVELTVGYVAGLVAFGIFIAQLWSPNILAIYLSGLLDDRESAATWSVAGRSLHSTFWPTVLGADTTKLQGVRTSVRITTLAFPAISVLIAIAGVITPLGLYETMHTSESTTATFIYQKDDSSFGAATPPRGNFSFTRICGWGPLDGTFGLMAPCPYSGYAASLSWNGTTYAVDMPFGYSVSVSERLRDIFSSGTRGVRTTVANYFDIEWRQTTLAWDENYNNGSEYSVGTYRQIQSMIMDESVHAVEGLVADLKEGGLGFRNHTLPIGFEHGATWAEDLLFIEPETECVDTNLTVDFTVASAREDTSWGSDNDIAEIFLTDRGGFANLNQTYPMYEHDRASTNPDLQARAYKAAWLNNAWTMAYMNVTSLGNETSGVRPFSYLNSTMGKQFLLPREAQENSLQLSQSFGSYLGFDVSGDTGVYANPFDVSKRDFQGISVICSGAGPTDIANISNIFVMCGLLQGPPRRTDNGSSLLWDRGSKWSSSLYACASAVKATIKTVKFRVNGTSDLQGLTILDVREKRYADKAHMPLWGFEESGLTLDSISPIWGLVSTAYEKYPNISTLRQPDFYLPGDPGALMPPSLPYGPMSENLPGSQFWRYTMGSVYQGAGRTIVKPGMDYTGYSSIALFNRWQEMSKTAQGAARIIDLIWTDMAAPAVVGTKGTLGHNNAGLSNETAAPTVLPIVRRIKYRLRFAIPAIILVMVLLVTTLLAVYSSLVGRSGLHNMRRRLNHTSVGRVYTWLYWPQEEPMRLSSKEWSWRLGNRMVDVNARSEPEMIAAAGPVIKTSPFIDRSGVRKPGALQTSVAARG